MSDKTLGVHPSATSPSGRVYSAHPYGTVAYRRDDFERAVTVALYAAPIPLATIEGLLGGEEPSQRAPEFVVHARMT